MSQIHNAIDYVEFPADDTAAVKAFYGEAFGWAFEDYGPTYACPSNAGLSGGFQADPEQRPKKPLVILYSLDLEATRDKVVQAGGEVCVDIFDFPGGRRFHFRDPSGNELAVWSDR